MVHLSLSRAPASFPDGSSSWNASAADALQIWNQHLQTVRFVHAGSVAGGDGDGRNSVFFSSSIYGEKFGTNTIAVTVGYNDASNPSVIIETDVIFNSAERWDSYRGPLRSDSKGNPIFDLHRVALHEFGHVLGLDHPDAAGQNVAALMNSTTNDNDQITDDDIAGVKHLYGYRITSATASVTVDAGQEFSYQIAANNGATSYSASGLPEGLSLDSVTGAIRGRPVQNGTFSVLVIAHGPSGSASATFSIVVRGPRILSSSSARWVQVGDRFDYQITAEGDPTHFSAGELPHGLGIDPATGLISGIPTLSGTYRVVVRAHTRIGDAVATIEMRILAAPPVAPPKGESPIARFPMSATSLVSDPARGRVYVAEAAGVTVFDSKTLAIIKRIPGTAAFDLSISWDKTKLLLARKVENVERIDLDTLEPLPALRLAVAAEAVREAANGRMYVAEFWGGVSEVDPNTGAVQARLSPAVRSYKAKATIEISPDGKSLFVAELVDSSASPQLARYDVSGATAVLVESIPAPTTASSVAVNDSGSLVAFSGSRNAPVLATTDFKTVAGTFSIGSSLLGQIVFAQDDSLAFVSTRSQSTTEQNAIGVFDLRTFQLIRTITLPEVLGFSRLAVDSASGHLFVYSTNGSMSPHLPSVAVYDIGAAPPSQRKRLLNVSTRMRAEPGDNSLIAGFIVSGDQPKKVVLRAIGPSLPLPTRLPDPTLVLHDEAGAVIASNENWNSQRADVLRTTLAPSDEREAVIVATLTPGSYTAVVGDARGASGVALVELYDLETDQPSRLANISTRGRVESGDSVMIGGFIIGGDQPTRVIVRAIGPSMSASGVAGALNDPALELYNGNGEMIAANDDWRDEQQQEITATGIPPQADRESAIVHTLQSGNYTAIVRGKGDATGVALVEVYNLESD